MELTTKAISELCKDYYFNIPAYQRGYRWDNQQIEYLLDDLYEYKNNPVGEYYCLQPIVVVKNEELSKKESHTVYDLIDGQQRLTSLFLILTYLESQRKTLHKKTWQNIWKLEFEKRNDNYLKNKEFVSDTKAYKKDINYFYIRKAYETIEHWFSKGEENKENDILLAILGLNGNEQEKITKVIWYDLSSTGEKPIDVFSRLNHGKIPLNDAELIKALILECDRYANIKSNEAENQSFHMKREEIAFRLSCEWDEMEKTLHNELFWSFITPSTYDTPCRLSLVIDRVARDIKKEADAKLEEGEKSLYDFSESKDHFTYNVINKYLKEEFKTNENAVDDLWKKIQHTFTVLQNWYNNREIYHYIGYLVSVIEFDNIKKSKGELKSIIQSLIDELFALAENGKTSDFIYALKIKIREQIDCTSLALEDLNYNNDSHKMVKILLLFNIDYMINHSLERARYPFDAQKKLNITSLEHIHPQHMDTTFENDKVGFEKVVDWMKAKKDAFLSINESESEEIKELRETAVSEEEIQEKIKDLQIKDKKYLEQIEKFISGGLDYFKNNYVDCKNLIFEVDKHFCDFANLGEKEMHSLRNMALVDGKTNSALGKNFLNKKREIIIQRENDKIYIPVCTKLCFNKAFSTKAKSFVFWEKSDRENYFIQLKKVFLKYMYDNKEEIPEEK